MHRRKEHQRISRHNSADIKTPKKIDESFQKAMEMYKAGLLEESKMLLQNHLKIRPKDDKSINLSGLIAYKYGHYNLAIQMFQSAIQLNNVAPHYHNNLGVTHKKNGNLKAAIVNFQKAIDLNPDYCDAAYNLGQTYQTQGELSLALDWYNYVLARNPNHKASYNSKATIYHIQGRIQDAIEAYWEAVHRKLNNEMFDSNYLFFLNYIEVIDPDTVFRHYLNWAAHHASVGDYANCKYTNDAIPTRRLRVGYVSGDFYSHSVAFFMIPILAGHDRLKIEVYCYSDVALPDQITEVMIANAEHWKSIRGMSDDQVFQCIQKDRIDILVDLAGHSANNRIKLFARKPTPIQVSYLGYPNTTGLKTMDYRITDSVSDPPGMTDRYYTEKLIRLPEGFLCYQPAIGYPEITGPPCMKNGYITFGSFNNRAKINSKVIAIWSELMLQIPDSRLILKSSVKMDMDSRQQLLSLFVENGISASRIEMLPYLHFSEHLKQYQRVDVALDTFPYNGTTTTCEALWMGVPVLTLAGNTHVSRVGASILNPLGLDAWIVSSIDEFVKTSAMLVGDIENLKNLRYSLRDKLQNSSLMDQKKFASKLEAAYRRIWIDRCTNLFNEGCDSCDVIEVQIPENITVCVPNDNNCMTSYILQEYQDWFEPEFAFVRKALRPGMKAMDIGAGYGTYALTAAKYVELSGKVWAFEPSRLTAAYLSRSVQINQLNNITVIHASVSDSDRRGFLSENIHSELDRVIDFEPSDIKEEISLTSLDGWMQSQNTHIDFIRLDAKGQEDNIIKGGKHFFESFSPLILYKIKYGDVLKPEMVRLFLNIGYQSYRLIPGLKILAPFAIGEKLDAFQLNLFCCKEDCTLKFEQQGLLVSQKEDRLALSDVPAPLWIDYLKDFPYVLRLLCLWQTFCGRHAGDPGWQMHQQALSAYAVSQLPGYSKSNRFEAMIMGYGLMTSLLKSQPTVSRMLTTIRMAHDLGYREHAVALLNHLYNFFESAQEFSVNEPFLAVSGRMASLDPGNDIGQWLIYGVLETRELCHAFSSYFTGKSTLSELELMRTSPFYSEEMERRRKLIVDRFGIK